MNVACNYKDLAALEAAAEELGIPLPLQQDLAPLAEPLALGSHTLGNRLVIQPMEGCDGTEDGSPGELTERRYRRFAAGGAGLIWFEAVAVRQDGRANARQLMLTEANLEAFRALVDEIHAIAAEAGGPRPVIILQATHSGRYSKPGGEAKPRIAYHHAIFEAERRLPESAVMRDEELDELIACYAETARLAEAAGFDGVDIKACHRYLISELLSAFERPGRYGGSYENRTRFLRAAIAAARGAVSEDFIVTSRINLYDGYPYPSGWGVAREPEGSVAIDLAEPIRLVRELRDEDGFTLLNCTIGNPYNNPHVNRPFTSGPYESPEHPLAGIRRHLDVVGELRRAVPGVALIVSGLSWLRQYAGPLAAAAIAEGTADLAGFGRLAFSDPNFARQLTSGEGIDTRLTCLACSQCSQLMRAGSTAGCVIRDREVYGPIYQRDVVENERDIRRMVSNV